MVGVLHLDEREAGLRIEEENLLLARLRRGERDAFVELAELYGPRLLRLAHRLLGFNGDSADVVQDVFAKLLSEPARVRPGTSGSLEAWLMTVTANACRSHRRKLRTAWRAVLKLGREIPDVAASDAATIRDETHQRVRDAVRRLPARDREAIVLHYLEQLSVDEVARILELSRNTVEVRLHRARKKLKDLLEPES